MNLRIVQDADYVTYRDIDGKIGRGIVLDKRNFPYDLYDPNPDTHNWFFIERNGDMTKYGVTYAHESKVSYVWIAEVVA